MPKMALNATSSLTSTCPPHKKRKDYYDTAITGFVLEVRPSGSKTYVLRSQDAHGRQSQRNAWRVNR